MHHEIDPAQELVILTHMAASFRRPIQSAEAATDAAKQLAECRARAARLRTLLLVETDPISAQTAPEYAPARSALSLARDLVSMFEAELEGWAAQRVNQSGRQAPLRPTFATNED